MEEPELRNWWIEYLSIPLNGFTIMFSATVVTGTHALSIPLNGFGPWQAVLVQPLQLALSIPLNGFQVRPKLDDKGQGGRLSIPLNGFLGGSSVEQIAAALGLTFNSIEWIQGLHTRLRERAHTGLSIPLNGFASRAKAHTPRAD